MLDLFGEDRFKEIVTLQESTVSHREPIEEVDDASVDHEDDESSFFMSPRVRHRVHRRVTTFYKFMQTSRLERKNLSRSRTLQVLGVLKMATVGAMRARQRRKNRSVGPWPKSLE